MNLGRFKAILDAYGAAAERWPESERADALALARSSIEAARALGEARTLDATLNAAADLPVPFESIRLSALQARILAAAVPSAKSWLYRWFGFDLAPTQLWPSLAGFALVTVLGFAVGLGGLIEAAAGHDSEDVVSLSALDSIDGSGQ